MRIRVLTFTPGIDRPCIQHIDRDPDILRRIVDGPLTARHVPEVMRDAVILFGEDASIPNRIVDDRVICGIMILARLKAGELVNLPLDVAEHMRDNCTWPQAQWAEAAG